MLDRLPRLLLHAEGLAVAVAALWLYFDAGFEWWLLLVLALSPDLSMVGYLGGDRLGAAVYDAAHTYALPILLGLAGVLADAEVAKTLALIWLAHIGADRAIGYGLKYPTDFNETHLQRV